MRIINHLSSKLMEDWGQTRKNPNIKEPLKVNHMKTGDKVSDEPPLNKILPGTKAWDGIPAHILAKKIKLC